MGRTCPDASAPIGGVHHGPVGGMPGARRRTSGGPVDLRRVRPGFRALFEAAGSVKVAGTSSVTAGFPRIVMRRELGGDRARGLPRPVRQTVNPNTHTNNVMVTSVMSRIPMRLSHRPPRII